MLSERASVGGGGGGPTLERATLTLGDSLVVKGSMVVMVALVMVEKVGVMVEKIYRTGVCMVV